ncbi:hypothetical protein, partial [Ekhidna sp.]|uniref:hypothetical protein n=1 Tax=Ekhidna sp. TaxID=2608089 RepID=UPI0032EB74D9
LGLEPRLFWTKTRRVASYTIGQYVGCFFRSVNLTSLLPNSTRLNVLPPDSYREHHRPIPDVFLKCFSLTSVLTDGKISALSEK